MTYNTAWTSCSQEVFGPSLTESCSASAVIAFATIVNSLLRLNPAISGICDRVVPVKEPADVYDFIVIGSGAGGSPVAARLSEVPNWKVLVLEAGHDAPAFGQVPLLAANLIGGGILNLQNPGSTNNEPIEWRYSTVNENSACASSNNSCTILTGRMLGGSTAHNGMVYMRGVPKDYDNWKALGNKGWSWKEVFPYFIKGENNGEIKRVGTKYHGTKGPLSVERFPHLHPLGYALLDAAAEAGFTVSEDLNGDNITGYSFAQATNKHGVRRSSVAAYLQPVRNRKNLHVSVNSTASRVIVENGVAVGVEYYKNGKLHRVKATKEVIVSAGAVESPKLLMLSGIGPKKHLESVGVDVVKDLPGVGENYHDHFTFGVFYTVSEDDTYLYDRNSLTEYLANQTGPLSGNGMSAISGRLATSLSTPDFPDIQTETHIVSMMCPTGEPNALRTDGKRTVATYTSLLHPKSKGRITLASKNYLDYPRVWGNYLGESIDVERLVEGIKLTRSLAATEAMKVHNLTVSPTLEEACSQHTFDTPEYWSCAVHQSARPDLHFGGSCKMGPKSDSMAVVDNHLRVYGIKGLRVVDASIMPQVPSANTGAPTMMIGERAADLIKADNLNQSSSGIGK